MAPIRVGLVGLTSQPTENVVPHAWASLAHLPAYFHSPDYELVAVCNSTAESARRAIEANKLPPNVKTYGNTSDLADDPEVDLIVVSVNVAKHLQLAEPAILKKKQVFVEWPLGASTQEAQYLADIAREHQVKTIVGVQGRADPLIVKLKDIIDSGKLGRITSSSVFGSNATIPTLFWLKEAEYYMDMNSGGNYFTISFGHFLDRFIHVLGGFDTLQSSLKIEVANMPLLDNNGKPIGEAKKNTPDHILVQGSLKSGAMASIAMYWANMHEGVDEVALRWVITGTEGEAEVTTPVHVQFNVNSPSKKLKLKLKGKPTEQVDYMEEDGGFTKHMPANGVNTGRILDAFAKGNKSRYADFDSALETHKTLEEILQKSGFKW